MSKKYLVELTTEERKDLQKIVTTGKAAAKKIKHANIFLKADSGKHGPAWTDERIAEAFGVNVRTIERMRKRLAEHGLEDALQHVRDPNGSRRRLDGDAEAKLTTIACSKPPDGRKRWTVRLLADKLVELEIVDSIGRETVRMTLKKTRLSLG